MYNLVILPTATGTIASIGEYSSPFFNEFLQFVWLPVGIMLACALIYLIANYLSDFFYDRKYGPDDLFYHGTIKEREQPSAKWKFGRWRY